MESILYILKDGGLTPEKQSLIDLFKNNVYNTLNKLEESNDKKVIIEECHALKGYFGTKTLKELLKNGQNSKNIKKNLPLIKELIEIEMDKLK